jgi:hypothetical protein
MVDNKDKELQKKMKELVRDHFQQQISFPQEFPDNKMTNDIIANLDRPKYLVNKYNITEQQIQFCYQAIIDGLTANPNVQARISKMVTMVRNYLEEGVGCQITEEEILPVMKSITLLTIHLLVQKNMW